MRRVLFFAIGIGGCGWVVLLAIYTALAVYLALHGAVPAMVWQSVAVSALGVVCAALLPLVLSRRGRTVAAFVFVGLGLVALLPALVVTYFWQPWEAPYCWICDDKVPNVLNGY